MGPANDWLAPGQTIGRYVVVECLGVGGMGVIYAARDPQLDRKLAIKLVRTRDGRPGSSRSRARLLREAKALARLRHPNVVAIHDVGSHDGQVYVAMEYVDGQTLSRWLAEPGARQVPELLAVFLQFGRGLAAAHRAGLVHRDVKPDNVMVDGDRRVIVLDFGVAREGASADTDTSPSGAPLDESTRAGDEDEDDADADADPDADALEGEREDEPGVPRVIDDRFTPLADLTRVGAVVGTPAYMSPEQHRRLSLDARSDQFSFCVAMWEALNGERPFGDGSREKLLARMRLGQLRRARDPAIPNHVLTALRRGLSWHVEDRFASMEALLEALNPRAQATAPRGPSLSVGVATLGGLALATLGVALGALAVDRHRGSRPSCEDAAAAMAALWTEDRLHALERGASTKGRTRESVEAWSERWRRARHETCRARFVTDTLDAPSYDSHVACLDAQRERLAAVLDALSSEAAAGDAQATADVLAELDALPDPQTCLRVHPSHLPLAAPPASE
nr:serine/threonine-protein kinase [Pseudenhygromyxa sp. WMMC2535]